jgi:hypothetical protein
MQRAKEAAKPKPDALEKALRGVMPVGYEGNPLKDPGWRSPEQWDRARLTTMILRDFQDGAVPEIGAYRRDGADVTLPDGSRVDVWDIIENQRRACYDLLRQGVDVQTISAQLMRDEEWIEKIRQDFNL